MLRPNVGNVLLPAALMLALMMPTLAGAQPGGNDVDQAAVDRAHNFLKKAPRGRDVISCVHFGAQYKDHKYLRIDGVTNGGRRVPKHFALVYTYDWDNNGSTDVVFFCDAKGNVYDVQAGRSSGFPWASGDISILVVGNVIIGALGNNITPAERAQLQDIVNNGGGSRGLLRLSLKIQQNLGW